MAEVRTTSSTGGQKGVKLARFDLIPVGPLTELAEHYGRGARKYASHQWRQGYEWSKSYAALSRHLNLFWAGFNYDVCSNDPDGCSFVTDNGEPYEPIEPDTCCNHTGSHHMVAVAWHAFLLLEFKDVHPEHDDRYVRPVEPVEDEYEPAYYYKAADRILRGEIPRQSPEPTILMSPDLDGNVAAVLWQDPTPPTLVARVASLRKILGITITPPPRHRKSLNEQPCRSCPEYHVLGDCPSEVYFSSPWHRLDTVGGVE